MLVIYAEKGSLAKTIAAVLHAGQRIPLKGEPTVGYYQFQFRGEDAVLCHGIGHLMQLAAVLDIDSVRLAQPLTHTLDQTGILQPFQEPAGFLAGNMELFLDLRNFFTYTAILKIIVMF